MGWGGQLLNLDDRCFGIMGTINGKKLAQVLEAMELFEQESTKKSIKILLNTSGGDTNAALAIYDRLKHSPCLVIIEAWGSCMSAGTLILQAGDTRLLSKHCCFMIHDGSLKVSGERGTALNWVEWNRKIENPAFNDIYLKRIQEKRPYFRLKQLEDMLKIDTIMTAQQAIDLGLADKIIGGSK